MPTVDRSPPFSIDITTAYVDFASVLITYGVQRAVICSALNRGTAASREFEDFYEQVRAITY